MSRCVRPLKIFLLQHVNIMENLPAVNIYILVNLETCFSGGISVMNAKDLLQTAAMRGHCIKPKLLCRAH